MKKNEDYSDIKNILKVDQAPFFSGVFFEFRDWLVSQNLLEKCPESKKYKMSKDVSWTFVTDGSADICRFLTLQCSHSEIAFPYEWAGRFCNLKRIFQNAYKVKYKTKIQDMLEYLELEFEGRLHRWEIGFEGSNFRGLTARKQNTLQEGGYKTGNMCGYKTGIMCGNKTNHSQ